MRILALESSCDDTAAAVVDDGRVVLSSVIDSQIEAHQITGGVVPEVAAREHLDSLNRVIQTALDNAGCTLDDIDVFAATLGPGLIGSLLIGAQAAKTLSMMSGKPFRGVHHLHAHIASNYINSDLEPPFLCLLVSGGHTQLLKVTAYDQIDLLGQTLDDAVGEAYDKVARLLSLGYPGGPVVDTLAKQGNPKAYELPVGRTDKAWDFSYSGLKTAVLRLIQRLTTEHGVENGSDLAASVIHDICASFQYRATGILCKKAMAAMQETGLTTLAIAGGVAANSALRNQCQQAIDALNGSPQETTKGPYRLFIPAMTYCTDNAAMVAASAFFNPLTEDLGHEVFSRSAV